jgi:hypothetical protein
MKEEMEIKYLYNYDDLLRIKEAWEDLYKNNRELTPYQSFDWNEALAKNKIYPGKMLFATLLKQGTVILIAPLVKRSYLLFNELTLLGMNTHADYLNFIYDKNLTFEEFDFFIANLLHRHSRTVLCLNQVNEISRIANYLQNIKTSRVHNTGECVQIPIYPSVEDYHSKLGKSTKKEVKYLHNKLTANFESVDFKFIDRYTPDNAMISTLLDIYSDRNRYKYGYGGLSEHYFNFIKSILADKTDKFLSACYINNKIAAYNLGFYSNDGRICVLLLTMDSELKKYNAGNVLLNKTICYLIEKNNDSDNKIQFYDLSRGTELYKIKYGGIIHINHHFKISDTIVTINMYNLYIKISDMILKSVLQRAYKIRRKLLQYVFPGYMTKSKDGIAQG